VKGGVGKKTPKAKTPKSAKPGEMKNPRTHFSAKIHQLKKAIDKAKNSEDNACDRISLHRDILEQSKEKVCKQFIEKGLSKFVFATKTQFMSAVYEDDDGEDKCYAHNLAELLRGLADYVDSKNAEAEALQVELDAKNTEFAQWQLAQTLANTGLTKEQMKLLFSSL
jgi:hypothetical protein